MKRFYWICAILMIALTYQNCAESTFNKATTPPAPVVDEPVTEQKIPLSITRQPVNVTVFPNQLAEFIVEVSDDTGVTFQWFFVDHEIPGENSSSLQITQAKLGDAGDYYVVVSRNGEGALTSKTGKLNVNSPVLGNLSLAVGISTAQTTNAGNEILAVCPAGETKISNLTVQNIPDVDQNEGGPGFIDFALCGKSNFFVGNVKFAPMTGELANCEAGFTSAAMTSYKNLSDVDVNNGGGAPNNVTLNVCDKNNILAGNLAITSAADCPAGFTLMNMVSFKNTGDLEAGTAPLNVTIRLCGK